MKIDRKLYDLYVKKANRKPAEERDRLLAQLRWVLAYRDAVIHVSPVW